MLIIIVYFFESKSIISGCDKYYIETYTYDYYIIFNKEKLEDFEGADFEDSSLTYPH